MAEGEEETEEGAEEQTCFTVGLHAPGLLNLDARRRLFDLLEDHQDIISSELDAELGREQDLIVVGEVCADAHTGEEASEVGMLQRRVAELEAEHNEAVRTVGGYVAEMKQQVETLGEMAAQTAQERDDMVQRALDVELQWRADQRRYPRPVRYTLALIDEAFIAETGLDEMVRQTGQRLESELRHFHPDAQIVYRVCAPEELPVGMLVGHRHYAPGPRAVVAYAFSPAVAERGGDA